MIALKVILSVLLFILKVIGIILLAAVILLLITLFSVLFVPVRYKAEGSILVNGENKENADTDNESQNHVSGDISAGISWLFHIISIKIWTRENKLYYYGKLFGKRIVDSRAPKPKKANNKKKKKVDKKKVNAADSEDNKLEKTNENSTLDKDAKVHNKNANQNTDITSDKALEDKENSQDKAFGNSNEAADSKESKSLAERLQKIYHYIYIKIEKIKFNFIKICDKIKNVNGTREEFTAFLTTEESKAAIAEIKCRIIKILLHIKPVKLVVNAAFGLKDPAATGQVYGALCILLSRYGDKVNIAPQFTDVKKPFVTSDFKCSGRIRAAVLLKHAIKIYKIKRLKEFIAFAKGKGKRNGR